MGRRARSRRERVRLLAERGLASTTSPPTDGCTGPVRTNARPHGTRHPILTTIAQPTAPLVEEHRATARVVGVMLAWRPDDPRETAEPRRLPVDDRPVIRMHHSPDPVIANDHHLVTVSTVTVIDGEVTFDGSTPTWPIVKIRDAAHANPSLHARWPHVGFVVASANGWRVNITLRTDGCGLPEEGTPQAPRVMIAPFDMDELAAVGPLLLTMTLRIESGIVDAASLPGLFDDVAARPAPPDALVAALTAHRAPKIARSLSHLQPPPVT